MTQIHDLTVLELATAIRQRELSPTEVTSHYLDRIERLNADVGAFFTVTADRRLRIGRTCWHPVGDGAVDPACVATVAEASMLLASLGQERMDDEGTLISLSAQLEAARRWRDRHPSLW